jgi:hypothetical protein
MTASTVRLETINICNRMLRFCGAVRGTLEDLAEGLERGREKHRTKRRKSLATDDPFRFTQMVETVLVLARWHSGGDRGLRPVVFGIALE